MDKEAHQLVKELVKKGQEFDAIRRELISQGHSTEGLELVYQNVRREHKLSDDVPEPPSPNPKEMYRQGSEEEAQEIAEEHISRSHSNLVVSGIKFLAGIFIIFIAGLLLSGYSEDIKSVLFGGQSSGDIEGLTAADLVHESNLKSMQLSAQTYKIRLLDYEGLCNGIGIDKEIYSCAENAEAYAIVTALSNGTFYCVDSSGFSGVTDSPTRDGVACQ